MSNVSMKIYLLLLNLSTYLYFLCALIVKWIAVLKQKEKPTFGKGHNHLLQL